MLLLSLLLLFMVVTTFWLFPLWRHWCSVWWWCDDAVVYGVVAVVVVCDAVAVVSGASFPKKLLFFLGKSKYFISKGHQFDNSSRFGWTSSPLPSTSPAEGSRWRWTGPSNRILWIWAKTKCLPLASGQTLKTRWRLTRSLASWWYTCPTIHSVWQRCAYATSI